MDVAVPRSYGLSLLWGHWESLLGERTVESTLSRMQTNEESVPSELVTAGVKVGIALIRIAPKGISRVVNWMRGRRILVLGQARAGKTSFLRYLEYGVLLPEGEQPPSYGWGKGEDKDHSGSKNFLVRTGRDNALELNVRTAIDVIGQLAPENHAKFVRKHKPHALVVIMDSTVRLNGPQSASRWLRSFAEQLARELRAGSPVKKNLRTIVVVMNKADKSNSAQLKQREQSYRGILKRALDNSTNFRIAEIPIMPCVLVDTPTDGKLADAVIKRLALKLSEGV